MTAERLSGQLQTESQISVKGGLGEYLRLEWFDEYPMDQLVICDPAERREYLQNPPPYTHEPTAFPENYGLFQKRVRSAFSSLMSEGREGECLIVVTHGFVVREFCYDYPTLLHDEQIDYCAFQADLVCPATLSRRTLKPLRARAHL